MHAEAYSFVQGFATDEAISIVEFGSRNVNFTVRPLFPNADYWGVDAQPGHAVDEVADAASWRPMWPVDLVVCCEVFEHTPDWQAIVANAFAVVRPGGRVVFTCAGPGRPAHGVNIDDPLHPGHYANVSAAELEAAMVTAGFVEVKAHLTTNVTCGGGFDTHATGVRPL